MEPTVVAPLPVPAVGYWRTRAIDGPGGERTALGGGSVRGDRVARPGPSRPGERRAQEQRRLERPPGALPLGQPVRDGPDRGGVVAQTQVAGHDRDVLAVLAGGVQARLPVHDPVVVRV